MMNILSERPASQTGAQLFGLFAIIPLDAEDAVVFDVQAYRASAAAVKCGSGADNFHFTIRLTDS
jgi:hypothetical protein